MKTIFTLLALFLLSRMTSAQIFVSQNASGANDGSSWANAFTDIQDALDAATSGDQIWITQGTYVPDGPTPDSTHFVATHVVQMYGGFAGAETSLNRQHPWVIYLLHLKN